MPTEKINKLKIDLSKEILEEPTMDWIITDEDPRLKTICEPLKEITSDDLKIIKRMVSYIDACYEDRYHKYKIRPGIAVAGPQMGLFKRLIYVHLDSNGKEHRLLLANPEIISKSQVCSYIPGGEGCLSVPKDVKGNIPRNYKVIVKGTDLFTGEELEISAVELLSVCLQHEIDHLDGILYTDRINKDKPNYVNPNWFVIQ